jgi:thiosulfate reductase cytochrome b subunit
MKAFRTSRWFRLVWLVPTIVVGVVIVVLVARAIRFSPEGTEFLAAYPGRSELPSFAPRGFPAWLAWEHGLNAFFMLLVIRSGILVRITRRPQGYWTRKNSGLVRTRRPPQRISLTLWLHLAVDILWAATGIAFIVMIFVTGQWVRIVPTSWDIVPNAVSAGLQYASLQWPVEDGWSNYNALQLLSYFAVVFLAAPVSIATGLRMAPGLASRWQPVERFYPLALARRVHYPTMVFFLAFVVVHVGLVFATGALRNLNHMYSGQDDESLAGLAVFAGSVVVMIGAWFALQPIVVRTLAGFTGKVSR